MGYPEACLFSGRLLANGEERDLQLGRRAILFHRIAETFWSKLSIWVWLKTEEPGFRFSLWFHFPRSHFGTTAIWVLSAFPIRTNCQSARQRFVGFRERHFVGSKPVGGENKIRARFCGNTPLGTWDRLHYAAKQPFCSWFGSRENGWFLERRMVEKNGE